LFLVPAEEVTAADQDCTYALLRKTREGGFEIGIVSGIGNEELQA